MAVYLDCNATSPLEPKVREIVLHYLDLEFGNAGSRTHAFGTRAKQAVQKARAQVAAALSARPDELVFTSGATESNNLALLGLAAHGERTGRRHIVSTQIEHHAVLEPLGVLQHRGFEITLVPPNLQGWVEPDAIRSAVRPETLLVTVMHANNETGVVQPIREIADRLRDHDAYLHVDSAQGFGKEFDELTPRVDLVSISGHKLYAPKGIGALLARRRGYERPPLEPLLHGGGQERGLRPGTLPVHAIAGLGVAAELAATERTARREHCMAIREQALKSFASLEPNLHGDPLRTLPHVLNLSFPHLDSEALILALKDLVAISNGSACTSQSYEPSHVLTAMGLSEPCIQGAIRISWCHLTEPPDWDLIAQRIQSLR